MDARTYGIGAQRKCDEWIEWMLAVTHEACRVSRGLVLWVCAGVTRKGCYWPGPEGLLYRWWAAGGQCWRPAYWHRVGIPGSGGKQWLRSDVEYVLAFKASPGPVPWADNTANGHLPKWNPGGAMSHRLRDGRRLPKAEKLAMGAKSHTKRDPGRVGHREQAYLPPALANPGNLITGIPVGGGRMGSPLAHVNEAPYPEKLCEFFIRSWCPPGGTVLDPFSGSGTTAAVAKRLGRRWIAADLRESQCELTRRRLDTVQIELPL